MTGKQRRLLAFIRDYIASHNDVSPSYDEMMVYLGLKSKNGVNRLIAALEEGGYIRRERGKGSARAVIPIETSMVDYERGRREGYQKGRVEGYDEGYRAAIREYGRLAVKPNAPVHEIGRAA